MKLYLKALILFFSISLIVSCKNEDKKTETIEVENNTNSTKKKKTTQKTIEEVSIDEEQDTRFASYIDKEMQDFKILPESLWLQPELITDINNTFGNEEQISFKTNVSLKGDFNSDGFTDYAAFMQDKDNQVYLMSFHQTEEGYKRYIISEEANLIDCCLARGISITAPGIYFEKDTKKEKTIKGDGIIYHFYANSKYIWYFDGSNYSRFEIDE